MKAKVYTILVGKLEENRPLGRPVSVWEDNFKKWSYSDTVWRYGLNSARHHSPASDICGYPCAEVTHFTRMFTNKKPRSHKTNIAVGRKLYKFKDAYTCNPRLMGDCYCFSRSLKITTILYSYFPAYSSSGRFLLTFDFRSFRISVGFILWDSLVAEFYVYNYTCLVAPFRLLPSTAHPNTNHGRCSSFYKLNLPGGIGRPERKADNRTIICEPTV
jgi:hypothetical protein